MSTLPPRVFDSRVQLLALCPLLAVGDTVVNAIGLGAAVLIAVPLSTVLLGSARRWLGTETALAASVLVVASVVACLELLMSAWFGDLRGALGVFLPLIVSNLVIVEHVQGQHGTRSAGVWTALKIAAGIALTLLVLGIARELVGRGSLLHDAGPMLGAWADRLEAHVFRVDMGFLLAMLPPGAFIALGLLIAARNWVNERRS